MRTQTEETTAQAPDPRAEHPLRHARAGDSSDDAPRNHAFGVEDAQAQAEDADPRARGYYDPRAQDYDDHDPRRQDYDDPGARGYYDARARAYDPRSGAYGPQAGGYYYDPRAQGYYDPRAQGYYDPRAEGYYDPRAQGGYYPRAQGGYDPRAQRGYDPRAQSGYDPRAQPHFVGEPFVGDSSRQPGRPTSIASGIWRHPFLTILPIILLLAAGLAIGARKPPVYSASATVNVGKSDIATQATPGFVSAAEALASSYSRLIASQHIAIPVAAELHQSPASVAGHLTAVPIPGEPTLTITATGASTQAAVDLGNAAIQALQRFVQHSATQQGDPAELLAAYEKAQSRADQLQGVSQRLSGRFAASTSSSTASSTTGSLQTPSQAVTSAQVTRARVASQAAALQAQALGNQYLNLSQTSTAPALDVLQNPTGTTTTNRTSNIEKYGVIGALAGLVIGIALAVLMGSVGEWRRAKRA